MSGVPFGTRIWQVKCGAYPAQAVTQRSSAPASTCMRCKGLANPEWDPQPGSPGPTRIASFTLSIRAIDINMSQAVGVSGRQAVSPSSTCIIMFTKRAMHIDLSQACWAGSAGTGRNIVGDWQALIRICRQAARTDLATLIVILDVLAMHQAEAACSAGEACYFAGDPQALIRICRQAARTDLATLIVILDVLAMHQAEAACCAGEARYFAGDWQALIGVFRQAGLLHSYDLILAAETIYSESSFGAFTALLQQVGLGFGVKPHDMNRQSCLAWCLVAEQPVQGSHNHAQVRGLACAW